MAISVAAGALQSAPALAQEVQAPDESAVSGSSSSSSGSGSSQDAVIGVVALATLAAAIGGGGMWAVQQGLIANPLPGIIPGPPAPSPAPEPRVGDCSPRALSNAKWEWVGSERTLVTYCDGHFAWASQNGTDWRAGFEFDGQEWQELRPAGETKTGMWQSCYNGIELRNKGASEDFLWWVPVCTPDEIGYSRR